MLELLRLCLEDEQICEYIYELPPPTYQYARFSDWFEPFATNYRAHLIDKSQRYSFEVQNKTNI